MSVPTFLRDTQAVLIGLSLLALAGCALPAASAGTSTSTAGGGANAAWDAGNIISDAVFYNPRAMDASKIQAFLDAQPCQGSDCLKSATYTWPGGTSTGCQPVGAGSGSFASMLAVISAACGINPQVTLVVIEKESQGLDRSPPAALTGSHCPDPSGCDPAYSGVWLQTWGFVSAAARLHVDSSQVNYLEGQSHDIQWNVPTSCGTSPVTVKNRATATLYTWTPYQPNPASLAAYPGEGDGCSSYGNRNFFRMFQKYFGDTGGGAPAVGAAAGGVAVALNGPAVTIPDNPNVAAELRGHQLTTGSAGIAKGLAAGFAVLGMPYVWGGGGDGAGPNNGCARGGGALNSCGSTIGFDCSGLTAYVLVQGGFGSPGGESGAQAQTAKAVAWPGLPGDIIHFPGHVAIDLGQINGKVYILEASDVGTPIRIVPMFRTDNDPSPYRYWT